jgi:hypothetical protein
MLLGWRDVVEGIFDITGKDRDAVVLVNLLDELTYRARSNLGRRALRPMKKGMILVGRLVRAGEDWMISGNPALIPASTRNPATSTARCCPAPWCCPRLCPTLSGAPGQDRDDAGPWGVTHRVRAFEVAPAFPALMSCAKPAPAAGPRPTA